MGIFARFCIKTPIYILIALFHVANSMYFLRDSRYDSRKILFQVKLTIPPGTGYYMVDFSYFIIFFLV